MKDGLAAFFLSWVNDLDRRLKQLDTSRAEIGECAARLQRVLNDVKTQIEEGIE